MTACALRPLRWLALGVAFTVLAGCAGQATQFHRYTLPSADFEGVPASSTLPADAPAVAVAPVRLAGYLGSQGIIYQVSDIEVNEAQGHLWAEGIGAQLTRSLRQTLETTLEQRRVQAQASTVEGRDLGVRVTLSQFQGRYDGLALVAGQYQLIESGGNPVRQGAFQVAEPLDEDGYPALVRALSRGWQKASRQIADDIARLPPGEGE